jgi:hypothetical protein
MSWSQGIMIRYVTLAGQNSPYCALVWWSGGKVEDVK